MEQIPVISINLSGLEKNPGFKISYSLVMRGLYGAIFGDISCVVSTVCVLMKKSKVPQMPCMKNGKKSAKILSLPSIRLWDSSKSCAVILSMTSITCRLQMRKTSRRIVGEILVKFLPAANNHLVDLLESEGAEAVIPDLIDFLLYCFYNTNLKQKILA